MKAFCLDTNALIEPWHRRYPKDVFPTFWDTVETWAADGRLIAPEAVLTELEAQDDDLYRWAKDHRSLFLPPEVPVQAAVTSIVAQFTGLVDWQRQRDKADPWVIAQAQVSSAAVVTEEAPSRSPERKPKIPDVCAQLGIKCTNVLGLIREMKLKF
jgi:hypothetical protein